MNHVILDLIKCRIYPSSFLVMLSHAVVKAGWLSPLLLWRRRDVLLVAHAHRMRAAAEACPAGHHLLPDGENARAGKISIDLPHQPDHLALHIHPRDDAH